MVTVLWWSYIHGHSIDKDPAFMVTEWRGSCMHGHSIVRILHAWLQNGEDPTYMVTVLWGSCMHGYRMVRILHAWLQYCEDPAYMVTVLWGSCIYIFTVRKMYFRIHFTVIRILQYIYLSYSIFDKENSFLGIEYFLRFCNHLDGTMPTKPRR